MIEIPLSRIDLKDERFPLSFGRDNERLLSSIRAFGIIEPVVLLDRKPYVPVAGHRRLACARSLGMRSVPAFIIDSTDRDAFLKAVNANLERGYNIIEKANILSGMDLLGFSRPDVLACMKDLDLDPHEKVLDVFLALARLTLREKEFIFTNGMSLRNTGHFLRFDTGERKKIMRSLSGLHLTESVLREVLESLQIIKIRTGKLAGKDIPALPDIEALRSHLKKRIHPVLTSLERKLKAIRGKMALPPGMDIRVDPFFEKEYIELVLRIKDENDIRTALAKISGLAEAGFLRSILDLTKGTIR